MIKETLNQIKEQTGLKLTLCSHFKGVREHNGKKYFNIVLNQRTSESKAYSILQKFSNKYNIIKIEPNGLKRVSIFINN